MDWLKKAIDEAGGLKEVARKSGISFSLLKSIYRGQRTVTTESADKLRPVLAVADTIWLETLLARPHRKRPTATPAVDHDTTSSAAA